jgi:hypothetical protein
MRKSGSGLSAECGNPLSANKFLISTKLTVASVAAAMEVVNIWRFSAERP